MASVAGRLYEACPFALRGLRRLALPRLLDEAAARIGARADHPPAAVHLGVVEEPEPAC